MRRDQLLAAVMPDTVRDRRADVLFYSGTPVDRFDWWTGEVYRLAFDLSPTAAKLDRLNAGDSPVLNTHNDMDVRNVLGVVERAWLAEDGARATLRFSEREDVEGIWQDIQGGIIQSVSMGVSIHDRKDVTQKGEKIRTYLATSWEPFEISVVPRGADPKAGFLSAHPVPDWVQHLNEIAEASASRVRDLETRLEDYERRLRFLTNTSK